jgi:hypothetical protein
MGMQNEVHVWIRVGGGDLFACLWRMAASVGSSASVRGWERARELERERKRETD